MNLSAEQFADIINSLSAPSATGGPEKRRAPRVIHRCRASIFVGKDPLGGARTAVVVRDLSSRGVCILYSAELPRGTEFVLQLDRAGGVPVHILATVAHCRRHDKGLYAIGAEFTCLLNAAPPPDRRSAATDVKRIRQSVLG